MKYPCENCVVDLVCKEPCDLMIFFLDALRRNIGKYIPSEWISTEERLTRMMSCYLLVPGVSVFTKILNAYNDLHQTNKKYRFDVKQGVIITNR